jgi:uncharacterized protein (TIGR02466 family)
MNKEIYFGSPIWIENNLNFLKTTILKTNKYIKETKFGNSYHSEHLSANIEFKELTQYIGQKSFEFLDWQGFDLTEYNLYFTEMWVQEFSKKGGGHHDTHVHGNNHVSGFYFLKCSDKTSYPVFHDPRGAAVMSKLPLKKNLNATNTGNDLIHFNVKPGDLIIFNSYMPHQFVLDHGKESFRFIHWNIQCVHKKIGKEIN